MDPEFPAGGGETPERIPARLTRIGAVLRITSPDTAPWDIAVGAPNWWRTPDPRAIAFISDWTGYVYDILLRKVVLEVWGVVRVREDHRNGLLLLITESDMTALGEGGVAWTTERIVLDDLKVVAIDDRGIVCTGYELGELPSRFIVDPATGKATSTE